MHPVVESSSYLPADPDFDMQFVRFKRGKSLKVLASICHISLLSKNNVVTWVKPSNAFAGNSSNLLKPIAVSSNSRSTTPINDTSLVCSVLRTTTSFKAMKHNMPEMLV
ncbi:hypothetical protein GQX74_003019 [Glossina fuscipes]|nr:hypothetical protein GQX74_003019 [Glossina fuscipes]